MTTAAAAALALMAALDWVAVARRWTRVERVAKPLTMVALGWLAVTMGAIHHDAGHLLLLALAFSLVGDVFLLGRARLTSPADSCSSLWRTSPSWLPSSHRGSTCGGR